MVPQGWLDWLYPRFCAGCGGHVSEPARHLCWDCRAAASFIQPPYCDRCGDPVGGRVDRPFLCALCEDRQQGFDVARSVVRHEGVIAQAIRDLKYHAHLWLVADLADLLEAGVRTHFAAMQFDLVSWIPLHPARRRERGFNQAAELARELAARLGLPARGTAARIRHTATQTRLTLAERAANVRDAFRPVHARRWRGARVLLVDDVMTTGATAHACARALREGGAASIAVITVSRG
ncbi:MAG: ComF family protein [Kiritimatiellae bacterium]|nr:ComF family protein [Kiritimatiellia bacterium]